MIRAGLIATIFLALVALAHFLRLVLRVEVVAGGVIIPLWLSAVACLCTGGLAMLLWREGVGTSQRGKAIASFGIASEQNSFSERNSRFMEIFPRLTNQSNQILIRTLTAPDEAHSVVFYLGRLVVEDFMEILLNCANGYGMAGLKLLRPMFEATVTALYLTKHPEEAKAFLDYHTVHQRKGLKLAESVGVDLADRIPKTQQAEIEARYQQVRDLYRQVKCPECGAQLADMSWSKKDVVAMCHELGLQQMAFALYFYTTLYIHTTPTRLTSRLRETKDGITFKEEAQRSEADMAMAGAHICLALILQCHNRFFDLNIADLERELHRDLQYAWP